VRGASSILTRLDRTPPLLLHSNSTSVATHPFPLDGKDVDSKVWPHEKEGDKEAQQGEKEAQQDGPMRSIRAAIGSPSSNIMSSSSSDSPVEWP